MSTTLRKYTKGDTIVTKCAIDAGTECVPQGTIGTVQLVNGMMIYCSFDGVKHRVACGFDEITVPPTHTVSIDSLQAFKQRLIADFGRRVTENVQAFDVAKSIDDRRDIKAQTRLLRELIAYWQGAEFDTETKP